MGWERLRLDSPARSRSRGEATVRWDDKGFRFSKVAMELIWGKAVVNDKSKALRFDVYYDKEERRFGIDPKGVQISVAKSTGSCVALHHAVQVMKYPPQVTLVSLSTDMPIAFSFTARSGKADGKA